MIAFILKGRMLSYGFKKFKTTNPEYRSRRSFLKIVVPTILIKQIYEIVQRKNIFSKKKKLQFNLSAMNILFIYRSLEINILLYVS